MSDPDFNVLDAKLNLILANIDKMETVLAVIATFAIVGCLVSLVHFMSWERER